MSGQQKNTWKKLIIFQQIKYFNSFKYFRLDSMVLIKKFKYKVSKLNKNYVAFDKYNLEWESFKRD